MCASILINYAKRYHTVKIGMITFKLSYLDQGQFLFLTII
jgi:hypothetical protein